MDKEVGAAVRNSCIKREDLFITDRHHKTVGQVRLRWLNQRSVIVIPESVHRERIEQNFNILDFTLTPVEMEAIAGLDTGKSTIYDDQDLATVRGIGTYKF
ncbi:MAG: aldo/keto reductase [Muribaculaceae bacterium]|nr:aldo/keto reductase [Muribaculaceae bacterium]